MCSMVECSGIRGPFRDVYLGLHKWTSNIQNDESGAIVTSAIKFYLISTWYAVSNDHVLHSPSALHGRSWRLGFPAGAQAASFASRWKSARRTGTCTSALLELTLQLNLSGTMTNHGQSPKFLVDIQSTSKQESLQLQHIASIEIRKP
jgi:hypothetical protein